MAGPGLKPGLFTPEAKCPTAMYVPSQLVLYSFNKYLLSIYYMPGAVSGTGVWQRTKQMKILALTELEDVEYYTG